MCEKCPLFIFTKFFGLYCTRESRYSSPVRVITLVFTRNYAYLFKILRIEKKANNYRKDLRQIKRNKISNYAYLL